MTKVLVAIDGSEHAIRALGAAVDLFGASSDYVLMSVVPQMSLAVSIAADEELHVPRMASHEVTPRTHGASTGTTPFSPTGAGLAASKEALYDHFRTAQRQAADSAGIAAEHVVEEDKPHKRRVGRVICEWAESHGVDAIVIGAHGSSYAGEVLLGSVSQYVLHHAPCPVLVVRQQR